MTFNERIIFAELATPAQIEALRSIHIEIKTLRSKWEESMPLHLDKARLAQRLAFRDNPTHEALANLERLFLLNSTALEPFRNDIRIAAQNRFDVAAFPILKAIIQASLDALDKNLETIKTQEAEWQRNNSHMFTGTPQPSAERLKLEAHLPAYAEALTVIASYRRTDFPPCIPNVLGVLGLRVDWDTEPAPELSGQRLAGLERDGNARSAVP